MKLISPHGGTLINREVSGTEKQNWIAAAERIPRLQIKPRIFADIELIAIGAYSPLEGFLTRDDYESVVTKMRLASGTAWSIPVTLPVTGDEAAPLNPGDDVGLYLGDDFVGILHLAEKFTYDK